MAHEHGKEEKTTFYELQIFEQWVNADLKTEIVKQQLAWLSKP